MSVVLVDWLGRGGIAQTSESWAMELRDAGVDVVVATRPGRELGQGPIEVVPSLEPRGLWRGRIAAHRNLVGHATRLIDDRRPDVVVVQNYVIPVLERPVHQAARRVGADLVLVVHDHHLHARSAGSHAGLGRLVRSADVVVAHTPHVAEGIANATGRRDVLVVPHPVQRGMLEGPRGVTPLVADPGERALALHFGILHRAYKGTATLAELARTGVSGWCFALVGAGAPPLDGCAEVVSRFLDPGELVATVAAADATLLPYRYATQSGAVVLAQALGSVVVASDVGGIPDQVTDGVDGLLLPAEAPVSAWRAALDVLADAATRARLTDAARRRVTLDHERFARAVRELAA